MVLTLCRSVVSVDHFFLTSSTIKEIGSEETENNKQKKTRDKVKYLSL